MPGVSEPGPMMGALSMAVALALDALIGWPDPLFRRIGHPVTWLGALIARLDRALNADPGAAAAPQIARGAAAVALTVGAAAVTAMTLVALLPNGWLGAVLAGVLAWPLVAARSLADHVAAVARPLAQNDSAGARREVAKIVGRDPATLDDAGIARAAIESLAENASDGVTAPLFWGALFGLPGIAAYKAVNTLDSMIGYRSPRHLRFGRVAARLDDAVNWIPARVTGALFAALSGRSARAWRSIRRDAGQHRSPNAGWPEAAMAGALDVRLSGPRIYDGRQTSDPFVHREGRDPTAADILAGLALFRRSVVCLGAILALVALI